MSIKFKFSLTELNARDQIDLEKIIYKHPHLVELSYFVNNNDVIFDAKINNSDLLANQHFNTVEKLIIAKNLLNIYDLDSNYDFSLDANNIVVLSNLDVRVVSRDVKSNYDSYFLLKVKAILFAMIEPKYNYFDYLNGGFDLVKNNPLLKKYINISDIKEFNDLLDADIKTEKDKLENDYRLVKVKSYKLNKIYKISSIVVIVVLLLMLGINMIKYNRALEVNDIKTSFINQQYSEVLDKSKSINIKNLSNEDKYIIAISYVKLETLPDDKMKYILSQLAPNTNERILNYWVYLSQEKFNKAQEEAYAVNDEDLLVYCYLKEIEYINNSDKYSLEEREKKVKELEGKIEELTKE